MAREMKSAVLPFAVFLSCLACPVSGKTPLADSPDKPAMSPSLIATPSSVVSENGSGIGPSASAMPPGRSSFVLEQGSTHPSIHQIKNSGLSTAVFIENKGQFDPKVLYQVKIGSQVAWLTKDGITFDATRPAAHEATRVEASTKSDTVETPTDLNPKASRFNALKSGTQALDRLAFAEDFKEAACCSRVEAKEPLAGAYNYFLSRDPAKWRTNVRGYSEVVYHDVWPGIDLRVYGHGSDLEQEFIVRPGGNLASVQISFRGIEKVVVAPDGALEVETAFGKLRETKPSIYQDIGGRQVAVNGSFKLTSKTSYAFEVGPYQAEYALVIDPTLLYSTFLGGSAGMSYTNVNEAANSIAVDSSGNAYVAGFTQSTDFPTTPGAFDIHSNYPYQSSFITKLNPTGSALIYSTYLYAYDVSAIAVDVSGVAYVTGYGAGSSFPTTPGAYYPTTSSQSCTSSGDFFVTALSAAGDKLVYSTCFGVGFEASHGPIYGYYPKAIAVDTRGRVYIGGGSLDGAPTTANAYQSSFPGAASAYIAVVDTTAFGPSSLAYATYLGPSASNFSAMASGIAVDSFGKVYIAGTATSGFPTTPGAFQVTLLASACPAEGNCNPAGAFVAKLDPLSSGSQSLIYSTYLAGVGYGTSASAIAVDSSGSAYVTGQTASTSFPVTQGAFQTTPPMNVGGSGVSFLTKLNAGGSNLIYSTYFEVACTDIHSCSSGGISANGIAVNALGNAYITGTVTTPLLPVTPDAFQSTYSGGFYYSLDAFLTALNSTGSELVYSTYLGGIGDDSASTVAVDQTGDVYVAGWTGSFNFPVTAFAFQPTLNPNFNPGNICNGFGCYAADAFVTKFALGTGRILSISSIAPTSGGNAGTVSPQIFGTGFHAGAIATLSCGGPSGIPGTNLTVGPEGRYLNTTFDLTATSPGKCDVTVTNPDGSSATLPQAFTVQQGGAPNIQIYLTGAEVRKVPAEVQSGPANAVVFATVSNIGNVDSAGVIVSVPVPPPFSLTSVSPAGVTDLATLTTGSEAMWSGPVAAGTSRVFTSTTTTLSSLAADSLAVTARVIDANDQAGYATCLAQGGMLMIPSCPLSSTKIQLDCVAAMTDCAEGYPSCVAEIQACQSDLTGCNLKAAALLELSCVVKNCKGLGSCIDSSPLPQFRPTDPNGLVGPPGVGAPRWTSGAPAFSYVVTFENEPSATAPAQQVVVRQPLGPNVNLATLFLMGMTIPNGSSDIQVPIPPGSFNPAAGVNEFITNVDLRPDQSLLVNVDAKLDPTARTLTWTFTSIDPTTGLQPLNPLVGFLPPGAGANFSFTVTPTPGLATGSQVAEQAAVVFDGQAPMSTPTWINTIDNSVPASHVVPLSATQSALSFNVRWTGADAGSGIQDYTIFVSDNGSSFVPWQTQTAFTGATYTGVAGHTYSFYSLARDLVGNAEAPKVLGDTWTQIVLAGPAKIVSSQTLSRDAQNRVVANVTLTNTGGVAAQNVVVTVGKIGTTPGSGLPTAKVNIPAGTSVPVTLTFPASVGAPGAVTTFTLGGTYTGGSFNFASRITLP